MSNALSTHHGLTWPAFVQRVGYLFTEFRKDTLAIAHLTSASEAEVYKALAQFRDTRRLNAGLPL